MKRRFDKFTLDQDEATLFRGSEVVPLKPKAFAVLDHLLERSGRLVSKDELLEKVWAGVYVGDAVLKECIREIRKALGDPAGTPRFIETVHRRGYRFLGSPTEATAAVAPPATAEPPAGGRLIAWPPPAGSELYDGRGALVGRDRELGRLDGWLEDAFAARRRVVFVTGEPGIGKSRLIETLITRAAERQRFRATGGQSVESHSAREPYGVVLDALARLCRGDAAVVPLVRRYAPTWLVQMPWLLDAADRQALEREIRGGTGERMPRELAELLEALAADMPFVLVLEDLHWADAATIDLIVTLAERRERAPLLIVGTYRPADVVAAEHPLKAARRALAQHRRSAELGLEPLSEDHLAEYLTLRFPDASPPPGFALALHRRTDGNPLFVVAVVDDLLERGILETSGGSLRLSASVDDLGAMVPESLRATIDQQVERLEPAEQRLLEAASIAGMEFSAAALAAALGRELLEVEEAASAVARRHQLIDPAGRDEWPDGTVSERFRFRHHLHRSVLSSRVTPAAHRALHRRIGERLEIAFANTASVVATELAMHFEEARDAKRAVEYLDVAARGAARRHASREAAGLLARALEQLEELPESAERRERELGLVMRLGQAAMAAHGYAAPAVGKAYARACEICREIGETPQLFTALIGLWGFHVVRGELRTAAELAGELMRFAKAGEVPGFLLGANYALGVTRLYEGDFVAARRHLDRGTALYDPALRGRRSDAVQDPKTATLANAAWARWCLGEEEAGRKQAREAVEFARGLDHPFSLVFTIDIVTTIALCSGDVAAALAGAEEVIALATEHAFALWIATGTMARGWARAKQGDTDGIEEMRSGLSAFRSAGAGVAVAFYLDLLADCMAEAGRFDEALSIVEEGLAIVDRNGEHMYESELLRLRGEILLARSPSDPKAARAYFTQAVDVARRQRAKALEMRAAASLARLRRPKRSSSR